MWHYFSYLWLGQYCKIWNSKFIPWQAVARIRKNISTVLLTFLTQLQLLSCTGVVFCTLWITKLGMARMLTSYRKPKKSRLICRNLFHLTDRHMMWIFSISQAYPFVIWGNNFEADIHYLWTKKSIQRDWIDNVWNIFRDSGPQLLEIYWLWIGYLTKNHRSIWSNTH